MRRHIASVLFAIMATSCVSNSREEPKASVPKLDGRPASTAPSKIEVVRASPCAGPAMAEDDVALAGCRVLQTALVDLDHDRHGDCVRWTRCGPDEPSALADGGTDYPRDAIIVVGAGGAKSWTLYTNEQAATAERFDELAVLRLGIADERLLARAVGYGTGNVRNWAIIDVAGGVPRRWTEPPLNDAFAGVIASDERLGKQFGRGLELEGGELEVSWLVYRTGDANCCPSGGLAKARLVPRPDGLEMARVWREPQP